jgi:protein SCO1/2
MKYLYMAAGKLHLKKLSLYGGLILSCIIVSCQTDDRVLPIYGEKETVKKSVNGKEVIDTIYKTIPVFNFLNQDSLMIDNKFFDGKVYIADFFFTSCPSICPIMHRNLYGVYGRFKQNNRVLFLSHSVDYKNDRPSVLKKYAKKLGVSDSRWQFVTGPKEQIYNLAEKSYISTAQETDEVPGGYAHSGYFLLVDGHRRLRGAYDGTDSVAVKQLIEDVQVLLNEESY